MYVTPYESKNQKAAALVQLHGEWVEENAEVERYNLINLGIENPRPPPERKERGKDRRGGIDWFIYCERILNPLLYPFINSVQPARPSAKNILPHVLHTYLPVSPGNTISPYTPHASHFSVLF